MQSQTVQESLSEARGSLAVKQGGAEGRGKEALGQEADSASADGPQDEGRITLRQLPWRGLGYNRHLFPSLCWEECTQDSSPPQRRLRSAPSLQ